MTGRLGFGLINSANPKPFHTLLLHYTLRALFPAIMTNRVTRFPPKHGLPNVLTQLRHKHISPGHLYLQGWKAGVGLPAQSYGLLSN